MAKILNGSAVYKDAQGNIIQQLGLSANDINKIKEYFAKTTTLEQAVKSINAGQRQIALKDYYTSDANKAEMAVGVYYMVPFNTADQWLEWDEATGKPKDPQTDTQVTDLVVSYFQIVYKNSSDEVQKLGKQEVKSSFANVAYIDANNTFTGDNTFEKDITVNATQDVDTLGNEKLTTAKWVRDKIAKDIAAANHVTAKYYDAGQPQDDVLVVGEIALFTAPDLLA